MCVGKEGWWGVKRVKGVNSMVTDGNQTSQGGPLVMYNSNHYVVHLKPITL